MDGRAQTGVVGCVHIDDYEHDVIRKHEKTRPDKEDDRTRHVLTLRANAEPVFLTYRGRPDIEALAPRILTDAPLYDFTAPDGVRHTVWRVPDPGRWLDAFRAVPHAYVADGHHRSASAWRAGRELRQRTRAAPGRRRIQLVPGGAVSGRRSCGSCPTTASCATWPARAPPSVLGAAGATWAASPSPDEPVPPRPGTFCFFLDERVVPAGARRGARSTGPTRSARSTCRCCRTGCSGPSSASATRAPTSGSTSSAGSGARRSSSGGCARARWRSRSRSTHDARPAHGGVRRGTGHAAQEHVVRAQAAERAVRAYLVGSRAGRSGVA